MQLPEWSRQFLHSDKRYLVAHGGRGSGKSTTFAYLIILRMKRKRTRVVALREIQTSIRDSVHALMVDVIFKNGFQYEFKITQSSITNIENGSKCTFHGLRNNPESIKSVEGIDIAYVEESQTISEQSMRLLIPTVRKEGSQIYLVLNPRYDSDYVYNRFVKEPADNVLCAQVNYTANPFFPDVLRQELEYDREHDIDVFNHVWLGRLKPFGERPLFGPDQLQIDRGELHREPPDIYGLDLSFAGFNALVGISNPEGSELYIHSLAHKSKIPLRKLTGWLGPIDKKIVVDSARPEVIDMLREDGFDVSGSKKGAGSVLKGADKMARYSKIWFAEGTEIAMKEFSELGFDENDELSGTRDCFDATRYALERIGGGFSTISWNSL